MDISSHGNIFVTANESLGAGVWDITTNKLLFYAKSDTLSSNYAYKTIISPSAKHLLLSFHKNKQQQIAVYDIQNKSIIKTISLPIRITEMCFSHDGKSFIIGGFIADSITEYGVKNYDRLYLFDGNSFEQIAQLFEIEGSKNGFKSLKYSLDDKRICFVQNNRSGKVMDIDTKSIIFNVYESIISRNLFDISFLPNPDNLICGFANSLIYDNELELYNNNLKVASYTSHAVSTNIYDSGNGCQIFAKGNSKISLRIPTFTNVSENIEHSIVVSNNNGAPTLMYNGFVNQSIKVLICKVNGDLVYFDSYDINSENSTIDFPIVLPSGIYLYKVTAIDGEFTGKFEVVK